MMKRNKIVAVVALICSFGVVNGFSLGKNRAKGFVIGFVTSMEAHLIERIVGKKLPESTRRGHIYVNYRNIQPIKYIFATDDGYEIDLTKEYIDSAVQQVGYVAVDAAVSKVADKVSQLGPIKRIITSEPIQYISKNISAENKKFFKDQAMVAVSAVLINGSYQVSEKSQALVLMYNGLTYDGIYKNRYISNFFINKGHHFGTDCDRFLNADLGLYGQGGLVGAITDRFIIDSIEHFVVKKHITEKYSGFIAGFIYNFGLFTVKNATESCCQRFVPIP